MKIYIRSTSNISPQHTFGDVPFLTHPVVYTNNILKAIEPDYKDILDAKLVRRMSRIIRLGVAAASQCLKEAGKNELGAIVTGTAYGCLEDTGIFLSRIIEQHEEMLSPTAFIQSTHNTVGAQIGLMLKCRAYNNTFVHKGFSFENALQDAMMLLNENEADNVLVGGVDELTDYSYNILRRFGLYRRLPVSNLELFKHVTKGTIAGEGAAFFLLASEPSENDYASIDGVATFYNPANGREIEERITGFISSYQISISDIDLIITGRNGDVKNDRVYDDLSHSIFEGKCAINYKHLCGEYPTSSAFALWLAANIMKHGEVPGILCNTDLKSIKSKKVLIYNNHLNKHYSLQLLSA